MCRGHSGRFVRRKWKMKRFRDNLREQNVLKSLFFGLSEILKSKIFPVVGTMVPPLTYTDFDRNLPFWATRRYWATRFGLLERIPVSCFIYRNLASPLLKKDVFVKNGYFSTTQINFCRHAISFFYLKLFLRT